MAGWLMAWPLNGAQWLMRGRGAGDRGQSHTIMLVIDMSDRAPASHTDTGEYTNFWKD